MREKYKKREGIGLLKLSQTINLKKEKEKSKEKNKEKEHKKEKSREKKEEKDSEKKIKKERILKNNKSINYILSDSETTNGDTLNDYSKKKYIYRKAFTKKNCSFAINTFSQNKAQPITYEKKKRLINSISLNKIIKTSDTNRNTNQNFYHKKSSLLEKYRTGFNNLNKTMNFYNLKTNNSRNVNELSTNLSGFFYKNEKIINIEDLLILEEKLYEIIYFLKSIKNVKNQCYDFFNFLLYSSIIKLDKVYKNEKIIQIIKFCINLELLSVILCYEFSFDERIMNKTYILLLEILEINRNSLIYICENILKLSKQQYQKDIWIQLLNKFVFDPTNENKKHYDKVLPFYESINSNNDKLTKKIKEILYNYRTEKSLSISSLLKKIDQKNYEQINDFFHEYIFRKEKDSNSNNYKINQIRPPFILSKRKKKFTLILSLEETLIHLQEINYNQCSLKIRPYLFDFLESVKPYYELILFTSKTQYYTNPIMNIIQRNVNYFDFVFYREHCILIGNDYIKDLTRIGRSLDSTIIVDNLPQSFKLQKENGIFIKSFWAQDPNDRALYDLISILVNIALEANDVRDSLEKYREEIVGKIISKTDDNSL